MQRHDIDRQGRQNSFLRPAIRGGFKQAAKRSILVIRSLPSIPSRFQAIGRQVNQPGPSFHVSQDRITHLGRNNLPGELANDDRVIMVFQGKSLPRQPLQDTLGFNTLQRRRIIPLGIALGPTGMPGTHDNGRIHIQPLREFHDLPGIVVGADKQHCQLAAGQRTSPGNM